MVFFKTAANSASYPDVGTAELQQHFRDFFKSTNEEKIILQ